MENFVKIHNILISLAGMIIMANNPDKPSRVYKNYLSTRAGALEKLNENWIQFKKGIARPLSIEPKFWGLFNILKILIEKYFFKQIEMRKQWDEA